MRLYIKDEYFEAIRNGEKKIEYREAHITFVNEKTGELLKVPVIKTRLITRLELPHKLKGKDFLQGKHLMAFDIGKLPPSYPRKFEVKQKE